MSTWCGWFRCHVVRVFLTCRLLREGDSLNLADCWPLLQNSHRVCSAVNKSFVNLLAWYCHLRSHVRDCPLCSSYQGYRGNKICSGCFPFRMIWWFSEVFTLFQPKRNVNVFVKRNSQIVHDWTRKQWKSENLDQNRRRWEKSDVFWQMGVNATITFPKWRLISSSTAFDCGKTWHKKPARSLVRGSDWNSLYASANIRSEEIY